MKILFATSSFRGGGISSYAKEVINAFSTDNEFCVFVGDDSLSPIDNEGVAVYHYDMSNFSLSNARNVLTKVNEINPDIIINSCAYLMTLLAPYLPNSAKLICVSHSLKFMEAEQAAINHKYKDKIIALSYYNKLYLDKRYRIADSKKTSVIYNFVNDIPGREAILKNKRNRKVPTIVFPGGSAASKAPEIVISIMRILHNSNAEFKFYFMGTQTPPMKKILPFKNVKCLVKEDHRFVFTGRIPRDQALNIISDANILLSPSRREGCPMALLEALRVGCIPIVSDYNIANKEIIKDNENGFVIPHDDISGFAHRIEDILSNPDKYDNIYDLSYSTFTESLNRECWVRKMNEVIENCPLCHSTRKKFGETSYKFEAAIFKMKYKLNTIRVFTQESLVSAIAVFKLYLTR